ALDKIENKLQPGFRESISNTMQMTMIEHGSDESIQLPFSVDDAKISPLLEAEMLELLNAERRAQKLPELIADTALREVARAHSSDMLLRSYFSHISPDGASPFDRIQAANIRYLAAGENLALAQSVSIAHQGLMNSPGHRA